MPPRPSPVDTHKSTKVQCGFVISNLAASVRAFTSNAFFVAGERAVLVDTGANFDVVGALAERTDDLDAVVLTHTHPDHVGNLDAVTSAYDVDVYGYDPDVAGVTVPIEDESRVSMGDHSYVALHTPGHKDDHICLYAADPGILFAGDLVFQNGGFGRTDLPEGDHATLIQSINRVLEWIDPSLPELHVGHGPSVTSNPYDHVELAAQMARTV